MPDPFDPPIPPDPGPLDGNPIPPIPGHLDPGPTTPPPEFNLSQLNGKLSELLVRLRRPPFDPIALDEYITILIGQRRAVVQIVDLQGRKPRGGGKAPRPTKASAPPLNQSDLEDMLRKLNE